MLEKYHWPGNIRELENLIKRYVILGNEDAITNDLVAREPQYLNPEINLDGPISLKKITQASGAGTGEESNFESSAKPSLEPQASRTHARHQLSRVVVQDPRSWIASESFAQTAATHAGRGKSAGRGLSLVHKIYNVSLTLHSCV